MSPPVRLTSRALSGFFWLFSGSVAQALSRIVLLAILGRLLTPEEFGIASAAVVVFSIAEILGFVGVAPALVHKSELSEQDIQAGLATTLTAGLLVALAIFLLAPYLATAFNMPQLEAVFQLMSIIFPLRSMGIVANALSQRSLKFRSISLVELFGFLLGYAIVSVGLAWLGVGYWSLVWAFIAQTTLTSIGYLIINPHRWGLGLSAESLKGLLHYGAGITISQIGNFAALNADYAIVGRALGAEALGLYTRAYVIMQQPIKLLGSLADQVMFPLLITIKDDRERSSRAYYLTTLAVFLLSTPVAVLLYVLAEDLILILLGNGWSGVVEPMRILVTVLPLRIAYKFSGIMIRTAGRVYALSVWQWLYAAFVVVGSLVGVRFGISGVALGVSIAIVACYVVGMSLFAVTYSVGMMREVVIVAKAAAVGLTMGTIVSFSLGSAPLIEAPSIFRIAVGSALVAAMSAVLWPLWGMLFGDDGRWLQRRMRELLTRLFRKTVA